MASPAGSFLRSVVDGYVLSQNLKDAKTEREMRDEERTWAREDRKIAAEERKRQIELENEKMGAWREDQSETRRTRDEARADRDLQARLFQEAKAAQERDMAAVTEGRRSVKPGKKDAAAPKLPAAVAPAIPAPGASEPYVVPGSGLARATEPQAARPEQRSAPETPPPPPVVDPAAPVADAGSGRSIRAALSSLNPFGAAAAADRPQTDAEMNAYRTAVRVGPDYGGAPPTRSEAPAPMSDAPRERRPIPNMGPDVLQTPPAPIAASPQPASGAAPVPVPAPRSLGEPPARMETPPAPPATPRTTRRLPQQGASAGAPAQPVPVTAQPGAGGSTPPAPAAPPAGLPTADAQGWMGERFGAGQIVDTANSGPAPAPAPAAPPPQAAPPATNAPSQVYQPEAPAMRRRDGASKPENRTGDLMADPYDPNHQFGRSLLPDLEQGVARSVRAAVPVAAEAAKIAAAGVNTALNPWVGYATGGMQLPVPETATFGGGAPAQPAAPAAPAPSTPVSMPGMAQGAEPPAPAPAAPAPAALPPAARSVAPAAAPTPRNAGQGPTVAAAQAMQRAPVPSAAADPSQPVVTPSMEVAAALAPGAPAAARRSIDPGLAKDAPEGQRVRTFMSYYREVAAPQIVEHYLSKGRVQEAETFQKWIDTEGAKQGMQSWAKGLYAANAGNTEKAMEHFFDAYDTTGYFDDGMSIVREESGFITDPKGNRVGLTIALKDEAGETYKQEFRDTDFDGDGVSDSSFIDEMVRWGATMLSPENVIENAYAEIQAGTAAQQEELKHQRALELKAAPSGAKPGEDEFEEVWSSLSEGFGWASLTADEKVAAVEAEIAAKEASRAAYARRAAPRAPVFEVQ